MVNHWILGRASVVRLRRCHSEGSTARTARLPINPGATLQRSSFSENLRCDGAPWHKITPQKKNGLCTLLRSKGSNTQFPMGEILKL